MFTNDGHRQLADHLAKRQLDAASGVRDWWLHDLRRTSRTLLSRTGVRDDVGERCLGHLPPGIQQTYNQHRYEKEMRDAFEALAAQIDIIVHPPADNILKLRG